MCLRVLVSESCVLYDKDNDLLRIRDRNEVCSAVGTRRISLQSRRDSAEKQVETSHCLAQPTGKRVGNCGISEYETYIVWRPPIVALRRRRCNFV
jgi:hypothetical protein